MFRVCLDPLQRSFGGKNPLRRVSKHERKLMQQVKQLRKRCSPSREQFYLDTIKALEMNLAECRHSINVLRNNRARLLRRGTVALRAANLGDRRGDRMAVNPRGTVVVLPAHLAHLASSGEVQQPDAGILIRN